MKNLKLKANPLLPTLRENNRYIRVNLYSAKPFIVSKKDFEISLQRHLLSIFGELAFSKLNYSISDFDVAKKEFIFRTNTEFMFDVIACLLLVSEINNIKVRPKIISVSGTIKKVREAK